MSSAKHNRVFVRDAVAGDLAVINEIAFQSKAYWKYPDNMMARFREELSWSTVESTETSHFGVAAESQGDTPVGFYCVARKLGQAEGELEALFVRPDYIGKGLGRMLMQQVCQIAERWNLHSLLIQSDPNAEGFYLAMGAVNIGSRPSVSIATRQLPLLRLELSHNKVSLRE